MTQIIGDSKFRRITLISLIVHLILISILRIYLLTQTDGAVVYKLGYVLEIVFSAGLVAAFLTESKSKRIFFTLVIILMSFFLFLSSSNILWYIQMLFNGSSLSDISSYIAFSFNEGFLIKYFALPSIMVVATALNFVLTISKKISLKTGYIIPILISMYHVFRIIGNLGWDSRFYILRLIGEITFQVSLVIALNYFLSNENLSINEKKQMDQIDLKLDEPKISTEGNNIKDSNALIREEKSIGYCIILSFVTFGIYLIIWMNSMIKKIRITNSESTDSAGELLALIFIPFYSIFWVYTRSQKLFLSSKKIGVQLTDNSVINLLLSLFGLSIVSYAIIQNDLNVIARSFSHTTSKNYKTEDVVENVIDEPRESNKNSENLDLLQKLADLKEKGVLTEEEFLNKKKELLDKI